MLTPGDVFATGGAVTTGGDRKCKGSQFPRAVSLEEGPTGTPPEREQYPSVCGVGDFKEREEGRKQKSFRRLGDVL